jgi:predicted nucleic acid-binding protein
MNQILQTLKILTIYFDTCCYGRPQDDQTQPEIEKETLAISNIINICRIAGYSIIGSSAVETELKANPNVLARERCLNFFDWVTNGYFVLTAADFQRARVFTTQGLRAKDSLHLAAAEAVGADFLITVDKKFERIVTSSNMSTVKVINPLNFK